MAISKRIWAFINNHFGLTLFILSVVSYGQMLGMYVWKDDNAIFFKFDHLSEPAGYLGRGLLGEGPYRLSVAPYWIIYKLFGSESLVPYYLLALIFYLLATYSVFFVFRTLISNKAAKVASALFAAGYIASEGFYWLASSWILSTSIILTCFTVSFYFEFLKSPTFKLYLRSFILYLLCIVITPVRTHYVIGLVILMELLWGGKQFKLSSVAQPIFRLIPFTLLFYYLYLVSADSRTASLSTYFIAIQKQRWYDFFSFFATAGNMFVTDVQSKFLFQLLSPLNVFGFTTALIKLVFVFGLLYIIWKRVKRPVRIPLCILFCLISLFWNTFSKQITNTPQIVINQNTQITLFVGVLSLIAICFSSFTKKSWRLEIFLTIWFCLNLAVYTSYIPTSYYASIDRYIGHSFVALVGAFALLLNSKHKNYIISAIVFIWGGFNLYSSVSSQYLILKNRSEPSRQFYTELKSEMPALNKGDVVYIDVADSEREHFAAAFSVGQMPESTAIAWRYKLDRYDFFFTTDQKDLGTANLNTYPGQIHSFFYNRGHLYNTSEMYNSLSSVRNLDTKFVQKQEGQKLQVVFPEPLSVVKPILMTVELSADPKDDKELSFPLLQNKKGINTKFEDISFRDAAYKYQQELNQFYSSATVSSTSDWQDRIIKNLTDQNTNTVWQPDRIKWHDGMQGFSVDLHSVQTIERVVWFNGFENNSPTEYSVFTSIDGISFNLVKTVSEVKVLQSNTPIELRFQPVKARYIKMVFKHSLNDDAPGISELRVISDSFSNYSIQDLDQFLSSPFNYVRSPEIYKELLANFKNSSKIQYHWVSDKYVSGQTAPDKVIAVSYDGSVHRYQLMIPSGGTQLSMLVLDQLGVPGNLNVKKIFISYE